MKDYIDRTESLVAFCFVGIFKYFVLDKFVKVMLVTYTFKSICNIKFVFYDETVRVSKLAYK